MQIRRDAAHRTAQQRKATRLARPAGAPARSYSYYYYYFAWRSFTPAEG